MDKISDVTNLCSLSIYTHAYMFEGEISDGVSS